MSSDAVLQAGPESPLFAGLRHLRIAGFVKTEHLVVVTNALFAGAELQLPELLVKGNSLLLVGVVYMNQREGQTLKV